MSSPAVISGVGVCCCLGDEEELLQAIGEGRSGLQLLSPPVAEVDGLPAAPAGPAVASPQSYVKDRKLLKYMSPVSSLAVTAAGRALQRAGLLEDTEARAGTALYMATGLIAFDLQIVLASLEVSRTPGGDLDLQALGREGVRRSHPLMPFKMLLNMPLGLTSIVFGLHGENAIYYPGPSQAGVCLESVLRGLRSGRLQRALVGGVVQGVSLLPLCTLLRQARLAASIEAAQPGSDQHLGCAAADGAAFLLLERAEAAAARGARALAVLEGAAAGQAFASGPVERYRSHAEQWRRLSAAPPRALLSSGAMSVEDERAEQRAVDALWPRAGAPLSFDGAVGWLGPAALPLLAAEGALMLDRGELRAGRRSADLGPGDRLLVSASDPEGGCGAALLRGAS